MREATSWAIGHLCIMNLHDRALLFLALGMAPCVGQAQWTTGAIFTSSQQFSAAVAFDAQNALFVNGSLDPWNINSEGQIVETTSGNLGQGMVFYYPSGMVLEDIDGWAGDTPDPSDSYYWAVGSRRTITQQIRQSVVVRNSPHYLPTPFMEIYTGQERYYRCVDFLDTLNGFCGGATTAGDGLIDRTADGGLTWQQTDSFPGQVISRIRFVNDDLGFAVSNGSHWDANSTIELPDSGHVYRTTDGGGSWEVLLTSTSAGFSGVWFTDAVHGVITRNDGLIFRTTDGGDNWSPSTIALAPPFLLTAVTGTPNGTLYASGYRVDNTGAIILSSVDGGASWQLNHYSSSGVGRRINNIYFYDDQLGYAPAWTCAWRTGNGGNVATAIPDAQANAQALLYPNPATDRVTVECPAGATSMRIIDTQGRTVQGPVQVTSFLMNIDISALAAGCYHLVIERQGPAVMLPLLKE